MIRRYYEGEHGAGFIGYRVAVYIDGIQHQAYFSNRDYSMSDARREALATEQDWLTEQRRRKEKRLLRTPKAIYHREYMRGYYGGA